MRRIRKEGEKRLTLAKSVVVQSGFLAVALTTTTTTTTTNNNNNNNNNNNKQQQQQTTTTNKRKKKQKKKKEEEEKKEKKDIKEEKKGPVLTLARSVVVPGGFLPVLGPGAALQSPSAQTVVHGPSFALRLVRHVTLAAHLKQSNRREIKIIIDLQ